MTTMEDLVREYNAETRNKRTPFIRVEKPKTKKQERDLRSFQKQAYDALRGRK